MSAASIVPGAAPRQRDRRQPQPPGSAGSGAPDPVSTLADQFAADSATVVDVDELVAGIEATGINDRVAQQRYHLPSVFALGEAVLGRLMRRWRPREHRPSAVTPAGPIIRTALVRSALHLTPMAMVGAVGGPLDRVPWPVAAGVLVTGWSSAQPLAYLGHLFAARSGPRRAVRALLTGFAVVTAAWAVLLAVAPPRLVGPDLPLAYGVSLAQLALFSAVTTALVTGAEAAVLRWVVPSWVLVGATLAGAWPDSWTFGPALAMLGGVLLICWRAYRPAFARSGAARPSSSGLRPGWADLGRAFAYLLVGLGQSSAFALVWLSGSDPAAASGMVLPPATVPMLLAVPLVEILVNWHVTRASDGLDAYDDRHAHRRHSHKLAAVTVTALLPSLAIGLALATSAYRLPFGLSSYAGIRNLVLEVASGFLLTGVFAVILLLTARRRLVTAAVFSVCPAALALVLSASPVAAAGPQASVASLVGLHAGLPSAGDLLPSAVIALLFVHIVGLALTARAVFDTRSYR
jgi:hypothetical protein